MATAAHEAELNLHLKLLGDPTTRAQTLTQLDEFITKLSKEASETPTAELYVLIGRTNFYLEQDDPAIVAFEKALSLDDNNAPAHFWRGLIARYNKDPATASKHIEKAATHSPTTVQYWYELGQIYVGDMRDKTKGEAAFSEIIKLDPKHPQANYQLGCIAVENKNNTLAAEFFKKAIEADPKYVSAHHNLGQMYQLANEYENALVCFNKIAELEPRDAQVRGKLVQLNYALNREPEALQHRQVLFDNWRQGLIRAPKFCREQLEIAGNKVIIYEYFELGQQGLKYECHVIKDDQVQYKFSCGSYDMTNQVFMEVNQKDGKNPGNRLYHYDGYFPGGLHKTFGMLPGGEPSYQEMKTKLHEVVTGNASVLSSSTRGSEPQQAHA